MWNRREKHNYMRYTTFISDGDSSSNNAVRDAERYCPDEHIEKQDSVYRFSKRQTSPLNDLRQITSVPKQTKIEKRCI